MKNLILIFSVAIILPLSVKAQFSTSSQLYCYEFIESIDNGVKSRSHATGGGEYYFVVFYKDYLGYESASKTIIVKHLMKNDTYDYYYSRALKKAKGIEYPPVITYGCVPSLSINKYEPKYSTSNKYSYWEKDVRCIVDKKGDFNLPKEGHWDKTNLVGNGLCFTFTVNKKELIKWNPNNPNKRDYYRLIDVNSLQPNLDFLD